MIILSHEQWYIGGGWVYEISFVLFIREEKKEKTSKTPALGSGRFPSEMATSPRYCFPSFLRQLWSSLWFVIFFIGRGLMKGPI